MSERSEAIVLPGRRGGRWRAAVDAVLNFSRSKNFEKTKTINLPRALFSFIVYRLFGKGRGETLFQNKKTSFGFSSSLLLTTKNKKKLLAPL